MVTVMRRVLLAATAMLAFTGTGIGVAATETASAATPSCGSTCRSYFTEKWGSHVVLDVYQQRAEAGTPVILYRASDYDPAQDWTFVSQGTVADFYRSGQVSGAVELHYASDEAFELEYTPYGVETGLCMGTAASAGSRTPVALERCGATARTVWINDSADAQNGYSPLLSGSDTNFSDPYVLQYPAYATPGTGILTGAAGCTPTS
jgi:hypothetical protein